MPARSKATENAVKFTIDDLPMLLNQDIRIINHCEISGRIYSTRVLAVEGNHLQVVLPRRISGHGFLRQSGAVTISFVYKGYFFDVAGRFLAAERGKPEVIVGDHIQKSNRRQHSRLPLQVKAGFAPVSELSISAQKLNRLIWKHGETIDISGGGIMIQTEVPVPMESFFLINLEIENFNGPLFIFGRVCWSSRQESNSGRFQCGIEFIPAEELSKHFSKRACSSLPTLMLSFDAAKQEELASYLGNLSHDSNTGDSNEF